MVMHKCNRYVPLSGRFGSLVRRICLQNRIGVAHCTSKAPTRSSLLSSRMSSPQQIQKKQRYLANALSLTALQGSGNSLPCPSDFRQSYSVLPCLPHCVKSSRLQTTAVPQQFVSVCLLYFALPSLLSFLSHFFC